MRVLWVVNIVLPQVASLVDGKKNATGGWINSMIQRLAKTPGVELGIAARATVGEIKQTDIDGIRYYLIPPSGKDGYDVSLDHCSEVLNDFKPDLLHVEGTEFSHARTFLETWKGPNVVSLQGVINGYEPYQYGGLSMLKMLASGPRLALIALSLLYRKHRLFLPRLQGEKTTIGLAKNLLGRTTWDRAHAYAINPRAPYFSCNRILRDSFYEHQWDITAMDRHTVFIGNCSVPLKGAHWLVHAVRQLKSEFPDIKVIVAGESPLNSTKSFIGRSIGYPAYLMRLIKDLGVEEQFQFTGLLQADEMAARIRRSHAYILTSTIENSPNTLGESMIQGVPCIAAYSGGVPDMSTDGVDALHYRDNDPQMLAFQIKRIFDSDELALKLSKGGMVKARQTHDPQTNLSNLLTAYETIMGTSLKVREPAP